jgi:hypothetical protein
VRAPTLWPVRLAAFEVLEIAKVITSRESPLHLANTFIAFLPPASRAQECARNYTGFSRQVQIMSTFYLPRRFKRVAFVWKIAFSQNLGRQTPYRRAGVYDDYKGQVRQLLEPFDRTATGGHGSSFGREE